MVTLNIPCVTIEYYFERLLPVWFMKYDKPGDSDMLSINLVVEALVLVLGEIKIVASNLIGETDYNLAVCIENFNIKVTSW